MSPEVYDDAIARILAEAAILGLPVQMPNDLAQPRPTPPAAWLDVEMQANAAVPIEIGSTGWEESGAIFLHVMIPVGIGIRDGLVARKALSVTFRAVADAPVGLIYLTAAGHDFDPLGPATDDGVYRPLTLVIRYHWQDHMLP